MHDRLAADLTDLPRLLELTRDRAVELLDSVTSRPVIRPDWKPRPEPLPRARPRVGGHPGRLRSQKVVCFTLAQDPTTERINALMRDTSDEAFFTPTVYKGTPALRAAFSNWRTTADDVQRGTSMGASSNSECP